MSFTKDTAVWEQMKKNFSKTNDLQVSIGVFEDAVYGPENDYLPVAQVWQWNEEGVPSQNIPPRPAIRVGFGVPLRRGMYNKFFLNSIKKIAEGKSSFLQEYTLLGKMASDDLKKIVKAWNTPPNAPLTVELKGFNDPLVETGKLVDSITYKVEKD